MMGLLDFLFGHGSVGAKQVKIDLHAKGSNGCWWDHPEVLPLAAATSFNVEVVGEAQWQDNIETLVGGKCREGHRVEAIAQLVFESNPVDPNAVGVMIDSQPVGWISAKEAKAYRSAILILNPQRLAVTCKAMIVGGWYRGRGDEGSFGVKLSLAMPLKIDPSKTQR